VPNPGPNWTPGYGAPPAPALPEKPPYNEPIRQPSHNAQSPPAPVSVQVNNTAEEHTATKSSQQKSSTDDMQLSDEDAQLKITPAPIVKSYVTSLLDLCTKQGAPQPQFHQKPVTDDSGKITHKVWIIMGNEKLELPVTFTTVGEGRERVAKQVLGRLRSQGKTDKS